MPGATLMHQDGRRGHSFMASSKSSVFRFFLKLESELLGLLEEAPVAGSKLTTSPRNVVLEKFVYRYLAGLGLASDVMMHCCYCCY